jgi:hypothetical protein
MTSLSGKDRDTDLSGSSNPCIGFRGEDWPADQGTVQAGYADGCEARQA